MPKLGLGRALCRALGKAERVRKPPHPCAWSSPAAGAVRFAGQFHPQECIDETIVRDGRRRYSERLIGRVAPRGRGDMATITGRVDDKVLSAEIGGKHL